MRVVFFTHTFSPDYVGGAEVSLYHTCRGLQQRGAAGMVLNINTHRPGPREKHYILDGIPVQRISFTTRKRRPYFELFDGRVFAQVRRVLRREKPDIFHVHNVAQASVAPFLAAWSTGTPTVCTLHDHWLLCPNGMLYRADGTNCDPARQSATCSNCFRQYQYWGDVAHRRRWMRGLTRPVARFIAPSQALIDLHVAAGHDPSRFRHVPNALTPPQTHSWQPPSHQGVREVWETAQDKPTLVFAGGGVPIKGAEVVLRAIPGLLGANPDLQLVIAGGGEPELLEAFKAYAPDVRVLGHVPFNEMRALFAAADLTLLASVWRENSPMVIYESYQVGAPVLAGALGGIPELIDEDETGYLFAPNDERSLITQVLHHLSRPTHERRRMRQNCVIKARGELSLDRHLDRLLAVYGEILGPRQDLAWLASADAGEETCGKDHSTAYYTESAAA